MHLVLLVPFVLQILSVVGIVGYLSLKNGQVAVENLANRLMQEVCDRVQQKLEAYLAIPHVVNQITADAVRLEQLNLDDLEALERHLFAQLQQFESVSGILIGAENETLRAVTRRGQYRLLRSDEAQPGQIYDHALNYRGNRTQLLQVLSRPPLKAMPWYQAAVQTNKPVWSKVFLTGDNQSHSLNANLPIYDQETGDLLGVASCGIVLSVIDQFLQNLDVSPSATVFVIERDGMIIGASTDHPADNQVDQDGQVQLSRLHATESDHPLIQATTQYLYSNFASLSHVTRKQHLRFSSQGEKNFVSISPFSDQYGLDWLIVVAIPESDFMAQITANTRNTILLCLAALGISIWLGIRISRWIVHPIMRLSAASQRIARGEFDRTIDPQNIAEIGVLVNSFNQMSREIQRSHQQLEDHSRSLESKVKERTQALEQEIRDRKQVETELQQAKDAAEASNRAKSKFLANMSHELRTPLNVILGFTQEMNGDPSLSPEYQQYLDIINRSGEHLLSLINDVLTMSAIEAGRPTLNENSFNLHRLLGSIQDMLQHKADSKGLTLKFDLRNEVPEYAIADEGKLRQVLINLLGNAIKFTEQGNVTLRVRTADGEREQQEREGRREKTGERRQLLGVRSQEPLKSNNPKSKIQNPKSHTLLFEVEDTGAGIPPEDIDNLFNAFTQGERGRLLQEGTGLGLPISRQFVQLMEGDITVSSTVNQGSVFKFNIQTKAVQDPGLKTIQPSRRITKLAPNQPPYRILVAEDDKMSRLLMVKLLTSVGFQVCEAFNGEEAVKLWESWQPHLIWMDMHMPIMNGYDAAHMIKTRQQEAGDLTPQTVIIALSATAFEEDRAIMLASGCDDSVSKPFKRELLLHTMARYLGVRYIYDDPASASSAAPNLAG